MEGSGWDSWGGHTDRKSGGRGCWDDEVILDHLNCEVIHLTGEA